MSLGWVFVLGVALLLLLLGVPVAYALVFPSLLYIFLFNYEVFIVAQRMTRMLFNFTLLAVPLFILLGSLMNHSGQTEHIMRFANDAVGHVSGGLAHANVLASLIFAGMSGSALADIGGIGRVLIETMDTQGYSRSYAAAVTSASSTIGPIFPPSIALIVYGVLSETSVLSLLLAGILPALLGVVLLILTIRVSARYQDFPKPNERKSLAIVGQSFLQAVPAIVTPVILIGGMLAGIFGPTEVAAVAVLYVIVANVVFYREYDLSYVWEAGKEATRTTVTVFYIIVAAGIFGWVMTIEGVPDLVAQFMFSITENRLLLLFLMNVFLILLGMLFETMVILVVGVSIFVPQLVAAGADPVHVGVVMVLDLMFGLLTPPFGLAVFVASDVAETPVTDITRDLRLLYLALLANIFIVTVLPSLTLWIPNSM